MLAAEIVMALAAIVAILQTRGQQKRAARADETAAFRALSEAVTRTREHIREKGHRAENYELTNLWHHASLAFRDAKHAELQRLCSIKGEYWSDPRGWSRDDLREAGIQLETIEAHLRRLLAS